MQKIELKKYDNYKDSGVEWLGEIPEHWEVEKGKWLFNKEKRAIRSQDGVVTCFRDGEVTLRSNRRINGFTNAIQEHGYQGIRKGDFVIHAMDAFAGAIGVSDSDGKSTPVYSVCTERVKDTINPYYFSYFMRDLALSGFIVSLAKGIRERSTDFRFNDFSELLLSYPPLQEQTAIANFLDEKCSKIDQAISQKQKLILLLKERKQILIQNAVTKGIGSLNGAEVKMKDSGVEWIGEIPESWEVKRLKYLIKDLEGGVSVNASESEIAQNGEIGVLKTSSVYTYSFNKNANKKVFKNELRRVRCPVKKGRIIISRMNAPELVGASGYVKEACPNLYLPDRLWQTVFYSDIKFDSYWLSVILISVQFRAVITSLANGSSPSMKNISKPDFLNICIPFPKYEDQLAIINHIETQSTKIDKSISLQQQQKEKLKEYKSSLINSAVTGKIKIC